MQTKLLRLLIALSVSACCSCRTQNPPGGNGTQNAQSRPDHAATPGGESLTRPGTPTAASKSNNCPAGERYPMIATPADAVKPEVKWNGDVNADGRGDLLLVDLGSCSNWGDCPYTLFLTCDSRHVPLWSGYANRVTPTDSQTKWKDLVIVQRNASPDDDHTSQITFRFDGDKYTEVPGSRRRLRSN